MDVRGVFFRGEWVGLGMKAEVHSRLPSVIGREKGWARRKNGTKIG